MPTSINTLAEDDKHDSEVRLGKCLIPSTKRYHVELCRLFLLLQQNTSIIVCRGLQGPRWAARRNRSSQSDSMCVWFWGSWGSGIVLENWHCPETQRTLCFSIWGCFRGRFAKKQRKRDDDSLRRTSEYPTNHILVENQIILWGTNSGGGPARWALPSIKRRTSRAGDRSPCVGCINATFDRGWSWHHFSVFSPNTQHTHTVNAALSLHHKNKVWALDLKPQCDLKSYFFPLEHKPTFEQRKSCECRKLPQPLTLNKYAANAAKSNFELILHECRVKQCFFLNLGSCYGIISPNCLSHLIALLILIRTKLCCCKIQTHSLLKQLGTHIPRRHTHTHTNKCSCALSALSCWKSCTKPPCKELLTFRR